MGLVRRFVGGSALLIAACLAAIAPTLQTPAGAAARQPSRTVTFGPVLFSVPAAWPVVDTAADASACVRFDRHGVYLGAQHPNASCPARAVGRADSIQVEPSAQTGERLGPTLMTSHGVPYREVLGADTGRAIVVELTGLGVRATIAYRNQPAAALAILDSFAPALTAGAVTPPAAPAAAPAAPATPSLQGYGGSVFAGLGFDTCTAPSEATMKAWLASPYRMVGIYIGGENRACSQPNLTATWVADVEAMGWRYIPTYVGLQAPCAKQQGFASIDPAHAEAQGVAAADTIASEVAALHLGEGAPAYFDMEGYDSTDQECDDVVERFLSAYVGEMHVKHLAAGVYGSAASTISQLVEHYNDKAYHRPDDVWIAHWDGRQDVFGDSYVPDDVWTAHQRLHQYQGQHYETWGGVQVFVDNDVADGNVVGPRRKLVFDRSDSGARDIYTIGPDGIGLRKLTAATSDDYAPSLSRDGTKIAFTSNRNGHYDVWVMDADGSDVHQVTTDPHYSGYPSWSPGGDQIVFQSNRSGSQNLWVVGADGTGLHRLTTTSSNDVRPTWSPGGATVAFTSDRSGNNDVWTVSTDGRYVHRLTWKTYQDGDPSWAPDGSVIAFESNRTGNFEIFTITPKGAGAKQISSNSASDTAAGWSPDSKRIAFASDRTGTNRLFVMDRDGTDAIQVTFSGTVNQLPYWA